MTSIHVKIKRIDWIEFLKKHWISIVAFLIGLICIIAMCGTWHQIAYYVPNSDDIIKTITLKNGHRKKNEFIIGADQIPEDSSYILLRYQDKQNVGIICNVTFFAPENEDDTRSTIGYEPFGQQFEIIDLSPRKLTDAISIPFVNVRNAESIEFHSEPVTFKYEDGNFHLKKFGFAFIVLIVSTFFLDLLLCTFKKKNEDTENKVYRLLPYLFVFISMILGLTMILKYPLARVELDLDTHYWYALSDSYMGDMRLTIPETSIGGLNNIPGVNQSTEQNKAYISAVNNLPNITISSAETKLSASRLPSGMGIALARMLGLSFYAQFTMGKIFNLIFYVLICFWALWYLESGRFILMSLMLIPSNLFLATNYEYDHWVIAFTSLGIALMVGSLQRKEKIKWGQTMLITFVLLLAIIPKPVYAPIMLFPLLMKKDAVEKWRRNFLGWIVPIIVGIIIVVMRAQYEFSKGGDPRVANFLHATNKVNASEQLIYLLNHPFRIADLIKRGFEFGLSNEVRMVAVDSWAYLGELRIPWLLNLLFILIIAIVFLDRSVKDIEVYSLCSKVYSVIFYFGMCFAIILSFYIVCTPVGGESVLGVQPRYIFPLYYPCCAMLPPGHKKWKVRDIVGWTGIGVDVALSVYGIVTLL